MENIDISIAIPAFNEARRLPRFLERIISYCGESKYNYEIIIVDDGSSDNTYEAAANYKKHFSNLQVIRNRKNKGKGYAVKRGLLGSKGKICLFLDADGSTAPEEIEKNLHYILKEGYDIFIGSRVLKGADRTLHVRWHRKLIGSVFNFLVRIFLFKDFKDTQCGFKMFKSEVVRPLFSRSYIRGFGFDIEILYLACKMGYKVKEGPVSWRHVTGSKINLVKDSLEMFFNILQARNWHYTPINPANKYMGPGEYDYMYKLENYHWWFTSRRNLVLKLLKSLKFSFPAILDVGAGTGGNLSAFSALGEAFGIDSSERAVRYCRERGIENIIQSPVEKIPFEKERFDVVTCLDVLEHVENPVDALSEIKRVLNSKGRIIITVPAFEMLWSQHDEALGHLRRYSKDSLFCNIEDAGLKVERSGYFFFTSFFIVAPVRLARRILPFPLRARSDTTTVPPKFLNEFLKFLFKIELIISGKSRLPFGSTIYAVVSKEGDKTKKR